MFDILYLSILLFKGLPLFGFLIFQFRNTPTPLYLCRDKTKGQYGKNATLTPTKTLPKKQDKFPVNFQIVLSTYKSDFQNKNYIYKIKTQFFFQFKNAHTPLCLSRDKTKGHSGKNATLTPTKTLPKKQDYSLVIFQITLSTYKLDS